MIYIDTSVALAAILGEDSQPGLSFWNNALVSSRLLQYEVVNRLDARPASVKTQFAAGELLKKIELVDMTAEPLRRALDPFPISVRTLDSFHLSTAVFLMKNYSESLKLATYDKRMSACAAEIGLDLYPL